ncbi:Transcriptional regulatory protein [Alloalcanivorax dieselolei B5]|uniref:Transcriptional regulatory protein n=1 Tax=Alcanivorax dieselolei (strain DSM 16502 / CGMCC 1.3690 / MCCC 1A00001 / B-5) TaxID=930169 RepID=K0C7F7_ALCDB|nr:MarR family transcriptional regulator [Alloalcanivorax dieselolei]AFT68425.1 Transcriptional regulatory protein [Alloalcanivorax dieselolei B5]GGJ99777.1 transcriptional regulator [Alloalcanivorax dieselolei]
MVIDRKINTASSSMKSLHELDVALELLHFGFRGLTVEADRYLATLGLSRVHHRVLYVIARAEKITVGELAATLGISKQALHRPLTLLASRGHVLHTRDPERHRYKCLSLTRSGAEIEQQATAHEHTAIGTALEKVSGEGKEAWYEVMRSLAERLN